MNLPTLARCVRHSSEGEPQALGHGNSQQVPPATAPEPQLPAATSRSSTDEQCREENKLQEME